MTEPPFLSAVCSWISRGESHTLCWEWCPGTKGGFWCRTQSSLCGRRSELFLLSQTADRKSSGMCWSSWKVEVVAGGRCSVWYLDLTLQEHILSFGACFPLTKSRHSPQTRNCTKCSFNPQWVKDFRECLSFIFHPNWVLVWVKMAARKSLIWCYFEFYF